MRAGVVIPVRGFAGGKARLHERLDAPARAALLASMATTVVEACGDRPVLVVSSAPEVVRWARGLDLDVIDDPGSLNGAAADGQAWWLERGAGRVVVLHADLPLARTIDALDPEDRAGDVFAVACRRGDGTPALSLPTSLRLRFGYGPGSFARHRAEAQRLGAAFHQVDDDGLAFDVDLPDDLDLLAGSTLTA